VLQHLGRDDRVEATVVILAARERVLDVRGDALHGRRGIVDARRQLRVVAHVRRGGRDVGARRVDARHGGAKPAQALAEDAAAAAHVENAAAGERQARGGGLGCSRGALRDAARGGGRRGGAPAALAALEHRLPHERHAQAIEAVQRRKGAAAVVAPPRRRERRELEHLGVVHGARDGAARVQARGRARAGGGGRRRRLAAQPRAQRRGVRAQREHAGRTGGMTA
jgi:hypothetical protein